MMKRMVIAAFLSALLLAGTSGPSRGQKMAVFQFPVEIELSNDQGDMPTRDYLKNYGTKGKTRGIEFTYGIAVPLIESQFAKAGKTLLPIDTLGSLKANEYGFPALTIAKAAASGVAEQYIRIHIKDVGTVAMEGANQADIYNRQRKIVKIRCKIQIYDAEKNLIREAENEFHSGDKIENASELGIDLRRTSGSEYDLELKVYETCVKVALYKSLKQILS